MSGWSSLSTTFLRCCGTPSSVAPYRTCGPLTDTAAFNCTTCAMPSSRGTSVYKQRAWVRQLNGTIERNHEDRVMEVIDRFDGRAFPTTLGLIRQWVRGRIRRTSSLQTLYCAELVAMTYQHMGLLPPHRPASWYDPGRFWSGDRLRLVPPFSLGAEIAVR